MSKQIEDTLDLPRLADALKAQAEQDEIDELEEYVDTHVVVHDPDEYEKSIVTDDDKHAMKVDNHLLSQHDEEMDKIADTAFKHHEDLMETGMAVEAKHSEAFLAEAGRMLRLSLDAKKDKLDKRLRMMRLQIDRDRMDMQQRQQAGNAEGVIEGENGMTIDRNDLLDKYFGKSSDAPED